MTVIRLSGVRFSRRTVPVLEGVDLAVERGERLAILGASGSGKTALLRLIAGLERPTSGVVEVLGRAVVGPRPEVTMVFQEAAAYEHLDVAGNLGFPLQLSDSDEGDVDATADQFSIRGLLSRLPSTLSLGQRGVVAAARAVVRGDVEVVLLDEALVGTDPHRRRRLVDAIMQEPGLTVVFSTNDPVGAFRWGDRVAVLAHGGVAQEGPPLGVYKQPGSLTVAELIGEMNRFPATLREADGWCLEVGDSRLRVEPVPSGFEQGRRVVAGIRPSDLTLASAGIPFDRRLQATIGRVEAVGAGHRLLFGLGTVEGVGFAAELERPIKVQRGQTVDWFVPADRIHLFDPTTENRL